MNKYIYVYTYTFVRIENTSFHWLYIGFTVCAFAQIIFGHLGRWFPSCSRSPAGPVGVPSEMTEKNISIGFNWNKLKKEISLYWQVYIPIRLVSRSDYVLFHILFHTPEPWVQSNQVAIPMHLLRPCFTSVYQFEVGRTRGPAVLLIGTPTRLQWEVL